MFVAGLDMLGSAATDSAFGSKGEGRRGWKWIDLVESAIYEYNIVYSIFSAN